MVAFILLLVVFLVYTAILLRFRHVKGNQKALQKAQQLIIKPIRFYRGFFRRNVWPDPPIDDTRYIETLSMRTEKNVTLKAECNNKRRRNSSVVRSMIVLASHARAATYILVIVFVYFLSQLPFWIYTVHTTFVMPTHRFQAYGIDIVSLKNCMKIALHNQTCYFETESLIQIPFLINSIFQSEETKTILRLLGVYLPLLNSIANPVLYAFWYPDFRKYVYKTFIWCRLKTVCSIETLLMFIYFH